MRTLAFAAASVAALQAGDAAAQVRTTPPTPAERASAEAALNGWTTDRLQSFENEQAFVRYLRDLRAAARARNLWWAGSGRIQFAQAGQPDVPPQPVCPPESPDCVGYPAPERDEAGGIIVTGTRVRSPNLSTSSPVTVVGGQTAAAPGASITNNQVAAVDEGDIVKQIGRHLLVLQDGRIFVVDTQGGRGRRLAIVERANVYRSADSDAWYDEMVVYGRRVLVTGYSYRDHAAEIAAFELSAGGRLTRAGTFHIRSNDYYSGENYSTRVVGDRLVLYTPIDLNRFNPDQPIEWPRLLRVGTGKSDADSPGRPLLDVRSIYRPTVTSWTPTLHAISVCRLGAVARGDLACRSTGFVAPGNRTLFVSDRAAFLWTAVERAGEENVYDRQPCPAIAPPDPTRGLSARVYRLPVIGGRPGVLASHGAPFNQLGMDAGGGQFRALLDTGPSRCELNVKARAISYFAVPENAFAERLAPVRPDAFTPMPQLPVRMIENRFTDRWLVFGGRIEWNGVPESDDDNGGVGGPGGVVAVPLDRPADHRLIHVPHNVIRAERAGDDIVLTGYAGNDGLSVSLLRLGAGRAPKIADTVLLPGRFESEGRSHAWNAALYADGAGIMGLPTVQQTDDANRWWWRSGPSDVSFVNMSDEGRLSRAGTLRSSRQSDEDRPDFSDDGAGHNGYTCEVSCIDWYGNTRPIFTDGRIFALTGTELVEGRLGNDDRIEEVQRLDLTVPVGGGAVRSDGAGGAPSGE